VEEKFPAGLPPVPGPELNRFRKRHPSPRLKGSRPFRMRPQEINIEQYKTKPV
jgi:hypothetical protein